MKKQYLHIDVETTGGFKGRLCFDVAWIVTDVHGNEIKREAYLIREALPFVAADGFWGQRKNDMLVSVLHKRKTVSGRECFERLQDDMDSCFAWVAFNSAYEASAFQQTCKLLRIAPLQLPNELDLALAAMDILSIKEYAKYAKASGHYTPTGNLSAKCEYLLEWLGLGGDKHCHLALEDTETQLSLYKLLKKRKKRFPEYGKRIMYPSHPAWREHLKLV